MSTIVKARIDEETKNRAAAALEAMGLSVSDAIRLLLVSVAEEKRLPFNVRVPNKATLAAIAEIERGETEAGSVDDLLASVGHKRRAKAKK